MQPIAPARQRGPDFVALYDRFKKLGKGPQAELRRVDAGVPVTVERAARPGRRGVRAPIPDPRHGIAHVDRGRARVALVVDESVASLAHLDLVVRGRRHGRQHHQREHPQSEHHGGTNTGTHRSLLET